MARHFCRGSRHELVFPEAIPTVMRTFILCVGKPDFKFPSYNMDIESQCSNLKTLVGILCLLLFYEINI